MNATVIIVAAGSSKRLPTSKRKPFIVLNGKSILIHTLTKFLDLDFIKNIILVVNKKDLKLVAKLLKKFKIKKDIKLVAGGKTRKDSVYQGLLGIIWQTDYIVVHDVVRPFFNKESLKKLIKAAKIYGASILAIPVVSTIKQISKNLFIEQTLNRQRLWEAQTPQVFKKDVLVRAFRENYKSKKNVTDDASLAENLGIKVKVIRGQDENIKITTFKDLALAKILLKSQMKPIRLRRIR